jgi:kynurenine formamidase
MQILRLRFAPPQDDTFHGEWIQGGYTFSGIALMLEGKRFTFVALPLKIRGGTGSPLRPVAILEE